MLSSIPNDIATSEARQYPAIGDLLDPQHQLAKLEGIDVIKEPSSLIDNIPYVYQNILDFCQVSTGLPWWGMLIGAGFTARLITLPFHIKFEKGVMSQLPSIKLEKEAILARLSGDLVLSVKKLNDAANLRKSDGLANTIWLTRYFIPGTMLMALNYFAIYGLTTMHYAAILECKFFWIPSLCLADPNRILSFANGIFIAAIIRRFIINTPDSQKSEWITSHRKFWTLIGFTAIAAQAKLPSALLLYWASSNATRFFLIDNLLKADWFRKSVGLVSYEEKTSAFEDIPKTPTPSAIKIIEGNVVGESYIVNTSKALKNDLTQLLTDGDFEVHKIKTEEEKDKIHNSCDKLASDLKFCEEKLKSSLTPFYCKIPNSMSSHYKTQKQIIKTKIEDSQKQLVHLEIMDRKRKFTKRKQAMVNHSLTDSEVENHKEELRITHSELLSQLEACERELIETSNSKEMQYFELYVKKQELLSRQQDILQDIEFCENEILDENSVQEVKE